MRGRRTPTVLQIEAEECGAASLAMILAYHGRYIRLEDLRAECGVSRDGATAANILKGARRHGLVASAKRLELPRLKEITLPAIVFVNMNHFLVLEAVSGTTYRLNDPAMGRRVVSREEFDEMFTGITLLFEPGDTFEKTPKPQSSLRTLLSFLGQDRAAVSLVVLTGVTLILPGLVIPAFSKVFVDDYLMGHQEDWLFGIAVIMLLVILLQNGLMALRALYSAKLEAKLALSINAEMAWRFLRLPIPFFEQRLAGSLAGRGHMAQRVADLSGGSLIGAGLDALHITFLVVVMMSYSPEMTGVVVLLLLASGAAIVAMQRKMDSLSVKTTIETMKLTGKTMIGIQSIESIKSSGTEARFFEGWAGTHANMVNGQTALALRQALLSTAPGFISFFGKAMTLLAGGVLIMNGALTIGALVAFQALLAAMDLPFRTLVTRLQDLTQVQGPVKQVRDVTDYPEADEFGSARGACGAERRLKGSICIEGLGFGFNRLAPPLLSDFSVNIAPGQRVALVGGSGSGKSTVAKLISGVYAPWEGQITFDDRPMQTIPRETLRDAISVVDQNIVLFEGSFRDNICLWDHVISDGDIISAARDAEILDFISSTSDGFDTLVEEGGRNLSGGQRQRLEIARALARNPTILILDEATSALDPIVEAKVMQNIKRRGTTCVIVAHRLSTIRDCDEIIVMDTGTVVQRGTHEALCDVAGTYQELIAT